MSVITFHVLNVVTKDSAPKETAHPGSSGATYPVQCGFGFRRNGNLDPHSSAIIQRRLKTIKPPPTDEERTSPMNRTSRRLFSFLLFVAFLFTSNALASRTTNVTESPRQDCQTSCAQKRDAALARCNRFSGDRKTNCQNAANTEYDTCVQNCANGGKSIGGEGKP